MESKQIDLEIRKADIEVLDKERELLNLKLLLARAQLMPSQPGEGPSS